MSSVERKADFISNPIPISIPSHILTENKKKISSETNGETIGDQSNQSETSNAKASTSKTTASNLNDSNSNEPLKIIGHIRNIEKINEKRRAFLSNNVTESTGTTDEKIETTTTCERNIDDSIHGKQNDVQHNTSVDKPKIVKAIKISAPITPVPSLKSPTTPPPKPPMLSRTKSLGIGDQQPAPVNATTTTPKTPTNTPQTPSNLAISQYAKTAPSSPTTGEINETDNALVLRRIDRPISIIPDATKQISINHYERLIEELKCPGCATPMKAPILLCETGHSICNQCTRLMMMCPLCKEPFTNLRCRTVEALCAKAHFRCCHAVGGCNVRLQTDLLSWHERQCVYKPMKCFMGRVWGDCQWSGREIDWKDHLYSHHNKRLYKTNEIDLIWNMGVKQKPLTGYYVFDIHDELFNFYEIYDHDRVLFTMTCTSTIRDRKHYFAYEVTIIHPDNDALAITQKFPVHSEYDKDILAEGTCVSISLNDLAKFIDYEKLLHYRVRLLEIKTPKKLKNPRFSRNENIGMHPIDFQQTQIEGANLKGVPSQAIVTRKPDDFPFVDNALTPTSVGTELEAGAIGLNDEDVQLRKRYYSNELVTRCSSSESDSELEAYIAKKWGTPQMHFNRKYLKNSPTDFNSSECSMQSELRDRVDDRLSNVSSRHTSYAKKVTNTLRKSFRHFKNPITEMNPLHFGRRSPEKKSP